MGSRPDACLVSGQSKVRGTLYNHRTLFYFCKCVEAEGVGEEWEQGWFSELPPLSVVTIAHKAGRQERLLPPPL